MLQGKFIFMGTRQWINPKNGNILYFVKIGNAEKMENYEFLADTNKVNVNHNLSAPIVPEFEISNYNGRANLNLVQLHAPTAQTK